MLRTLTVLAIATLGLSACSSSGKTTADSSAPNTLSKKEVKEGWQLLFDGTSTKGWHTYGKNDVGSAWQISDGTLHLDASRKDGWQTSGGGDIVTNESFENYHLVLQWKISPNGNSGVIFNVQDDPAKYEFVWHTGPEMQVLDNDGHSDGKIYKHRAGNLYDLIASPTDPVKPVGEWNTAEIIQKRGKLELRLNGVTTVSTTTGDAAWKALIAGSKFNDKPVFGTIFSGKLALQDHGNDVWFRNIKIQKL
jgi:hypothetical protein